MTWWLITGCCVVFISLIISWLLGLSYPLLIMLNTLAWDAANGRLGIGTWNPTGMSQIRSLTIVEAQLAILVIAFVLITLVQAYQIERLQRQTEQLQGQLFELASLVQDLKER